MGADPHMCEIGARTFYVHGNDEEKRDVEIGYAIGKEENMSEKLSKSKKLVYL